MSYATFLIVMTGILGISVLTGCLLSILEVNEPYNLTALITTFVVFIMIVSVPLRAGLARVDSGGWRQRLSIARATFSNPLVYGIFLGLGAGASLDFLLGESSDQFFGTMEKIYPLFFVVAVIAYFLIRTNSNQGEEK